MRVVSHGNYQCETPKSKNNHPAAMKKNTDDLVACTGNKLSEAATIRRAEIAAERGKYQALERFHLN